MAIMNFVNSLGKKTIVDKRYSTHLACDSGLELSKTLGIYDKLNGVCYRATYIVDPTGL